MMGQLSSFYAQSLSTPSTSTGTTTTSTTAAPAQPHPTIDATSPATALKRPEIAVLSLASFGGLAGGIQPMADRIMTLILQLIQGAGKTSTVLEDAFLVIGSLAAAIDHNHPSASSSVSFATYSLQLNSRAFQAAS
ncbi:hypothetical protein EDD22DRAFT_1015595 [Suillus occidentalis]|nr:hypothetical protein EDD22DRAFT_1015595 [Suillus occidentalis]